MKQDKDRTPEQITFTEAEVTVLVDFFNLVASKAVMTLTPKEVTVMAGLMSGYKKHLDKVEAHILEVKRITKAPKSEATGG